jgi:hypothetical protein
MTRRKPRAVTVLFSEGSSLSARQALSALGPLGYRIDVCDPNPFCISRFSRFVRRFYRSPALGTDPAAYLKFVVDRLRKGRYDVLLPVHEQAFLFARIQEKLTPADRGLRLCELPGSGAAAEAAPPNTGLPIPARCSSDR